ncbi:MAG: hypothetical protein JJT96_11465 [Opitutales bacterium]|nr:hypothetical protein [Opitutales bacterium]
MKSKDLLTADERFPTSGEPKRIEYYYCYGNPGLNGWWNGVDWSDSWDDRQKDKFRFFFQPEESQVGMPQRERVAVNRAEIYWKRKIIDELKGSSIIIGVACLIGAIALAALIHPLLFLIGLIVALIFIAPKWLQISKLNSRISKLVTLNTALEREVEELIKQIPSPPDSGTIRRYLNEELRYLELKFLSDAVNATVTSENIDDFIRHKPVDDRVRSLLVDGWGLMQPVSFKDGDSTGFQSVVNSIGSRIAAFRVAKTGECFFQVYYLQFIFLLEKKLAVCGLFYDFLSRKAYGRREEGFQYQHVTNLRISEKDTTVPSVQLEIPPSMIGDLFGKSVNAFSIMVSSGSRFECVLVDDVVVGGLNRWLTLRQEQDAIVNVNLDRDSVLKNFDGNEKEAEKYLKEQREKAVRIERELLLIASQESTSKARVVRAQVDARLEEFSP